MKKQCFRSRFLAIATLLLLTSTLTAQQRPIPIDSSYNLAAVYRQIHPDYPFARPATDSLPAGVTAHRNLVYATLEATPYGRRQLRLDLFQPRPASRPCPALVMIHGGGWRSGNRQLQVPMAQLLAAKGILTVVVDYQLSLEAPYPAAVHNIKAAIRWVKANADQFGLDSNRVWVSGCSAGGQLAALVGLSNDQPLLEGNQGTLSAGSRVCGIIDIDGVINFMAPGSLNLDRQDDSPDIAWLGGRFEQVPAIWKEASPIYWAKPESAVPMLFLNSGFPRFHAGQDELTGMLRTWKIDYEVWPFDVKVHPFWLFHPWVDTAVEKMAAFIWWVLPED